MYLYRVTAAVHTMVFDQSPSTSLVLFSSATPSLVNMYLYRVTAAVHTAVFDLSPNISLVAFSSATLGSLPTHSTFLHTCCLQ